MNVEDIVQIKIADAARKIEAARRDRAARQAARRRGLAQRHARKLRNLASRPPADPAAPGGTFFQAASPLPDDPPDAA